jgi:SWI/SNF-related matrix-associated actin-dependent regulator of chromatin subfamily A-like protein 1
LSQNDAPQGTGVTAFSFLVPPWQHQREAFEKARDLPYFGLLLDLGTGKTATVINILRWKFMKAGRVLRTIYFGPPVIVQNVKREFFTHSKVGDKVVCLEGSGKARAALIRKHFEQPVIFVTNYEALNMPEVFNLLLEWAPEAIVFDESHKIKSIKAKRTKLALRLANLAKHRYILTGTLLPNSAQDVFSQFLAMDGGATFGKNPYIFRAEYFDDKNKHMPREKYFPNFVLKAGALETLHKKIQPLTMVVRKEDCLDLPPLVRQTVYVPLSKEQARLYAAMKEDFIAYVGDKACVASLAITKMLRLMQIVSGFVSLVGEGEDASDVQIKDNPRAEALAELLTEISPRAKCIVWNQFKTGYATIRKICDGLGLKYVELHGEVSPSKRQEAIDSFNNDATVRVLIGHPASGGVGCNLCAASYAIFYTRGFSWADDAQAEARCYRAGSEIHSKITRINLVAAGTIDELIAEKLAAKEEMSAKVLGDIARRL